MPRGIPWDDLTLFREKKVAVEPTVEALNAEAEPRDFNKDAYNIGKRALFGLVVGSDFIACFRYQQYQGYLHYFCCSIILI